MKLCNGCGIWTIPSSETICVPCAMARNLLALTDEVMTVFDTSPADCRDAEVDFKLREGNVIELQHLKPLGIRRGEPWSR